MNFFSYKVGCRTCLQQDGIRQTLLLKHIEEGYGDRTEFEVVKDLESSNNNKCQFCGSTNLEYLDIEINNTQLYDFDKLAARCQENREYLLMFNIDKIGNEINLRPGGSKKFDVSFLRQAIQVIIETIKGRPNSYFESQLKGNFFVCVSEDSNFKNSTTVKIERFRTAGLTRNEILNAIKPFAEQAGISINVELDSKTSNTNFLEGKTFKGALFNSWFYADSIEEAEKNGYAYSNACFKINESTLIAHGTGSSESPRDFIDNNTYNTFMVDNSKGPFNIQGKTVYYAKKC
jgi:hypothetical protein